MRTIQKLISLHKHLFAAAMFFTVASACLNLAWNSFLAYLIDKLESVSSFTFAGMEISWTEILLTGTIVVLLLAASEFSALFLAGLSCEYFAHEMRMGCARFYLQSDIRTISKLNVGEAQSAMQNELREISSYLNENLFSLVKQFVSFAVTVGYLLWQNGKLALVTILPVVPLIIYCSFSSKKIKTYTEQCQEARKKMNGVTTMLLDLFPIIQVYRAQRLIAETMQERCLEWSNSSIRKERIAARLMSLSGVLSFVPLLVLLGFGGSMVQTGQISLGIFYIFVNLSGNVSGFLQNMPNIYAGFRRFRASLDRIEKTLVLKAERRSYVSICSIFR